MRSLILAIVFVCALAFVSESQAGCGFGNGFARQNFAFRRGFVPVRQGFAFRQPGLLDFLLGRNVFLGNGGFRRGGFNQFRGGGCGF